MSCGIGKCDSQLRPKKNRSGNRAYRAKEIEIIRYIKYLLYEEMYTIPGAKKKMADANMSDLDGQLTLLRVPVTAPPSPAAPLQPGQAPQSAHGTATDTLQAEQDHDDEEAGATLEPEANSDSHAGDGGQAAARLREELKRVEQELQSLLAALAASGR